MPKLTTEEIAKIRNALTRLLLTAQQIPPPIPRHDIIEQVERIDKLLPQIRTVDIGRGAK